MCSIIMSIFEVEEVLTHFAVISTVDTAKCLRIRFMVNIVLPTLRYFSHDWRYLISTLSCLLRFIFHISFLGKYFILDIMYETVYRLAIIKR